MKKRFEIIILISFVFFLLSCEDDSQLVTPNTGTYTDGILIVNEGPFNNGTGTVTYTNRDGTVMEQKIFQAANSELPIGSVAQSMAVVGDKAYVLVNNANSIEVVNRHTFKILSTIQNIELPRYMIQASETKSYVTCWDGEIRVINNEENIVIAGIEGSVGQEKLLKVSDEVWVLNQGGYSVDSTISIVNIATDKIEHTINVYPRPTGICEDNQGLIWVMCSGRATYHPGGASEGHLIAINKSSYHIEEDYAFPNYMKQPTSLIINEPGNELFYIYPGGINRFQIMDDTLKLSPFISYSGSFYSLGFDPVLNQIWASDALDYGQNGPVFIYDASTGIEQRSFKAGIIPSFFYFSEK